MALVEHYYSINQCRSFQGQFEGVTIILFAQNFSYDITHYESWWIIVRGGIRPSTEFRKFPDKVQCFT